MTTLVALTLSLVGGGGVAVGAGLIRLSNTVSRLDTSLDALHDRLAAVEVTLYKIAPPTLKLPPH